MNIRWGLPDLLSQAIPGVRCFQRYLEKGQWGLFAYLPNSGIDKELAKGLQEYNGVFLEVLCCRLSRAAECS